DGPGGRVLAGSAGELDPSGRLRDLALRDLVVVLDRTTLELGETRAGRLHIDLLLELRVGGPHVGARHALVRRHVQEPAVDDRAGLATIGQHPQRTDRELHEQRRVPTEDPDLAVDAARDQLLNVARPHLPDRCDDVDLDGHRRAPAFGCLSAIYAAASICLACSTASSIPPPRKNACSGRWSYSPSHSALNDAIVSSTGVYLPGRPVNCSATKNGCDRNRWILRARETITLSSSASSSIPRIAMMSCRSLYRCRISCTRRAVA